MLSPAEQDIPSDGRRRFALALPWAVLAGPMALGACALDPDRDHRDADAPRAAPLPRKPRTAWVFSSGGPRGFVHVGVLKGLQELGVAPDLIVGASAGALLGVLRAAGLQGRELETLALGVQPTSMVRLAAPGGSGERFSGAALGDLVREQLRARGLSGRLQDLPMMAVCMAYRPEGAALVPLSQGDAGLAVQASAAIEGQFAPVRIDGRLHLDADQHMPLPVRIARQLGASHVLAVDASAHEQRVPPGAERYRVGDLHKRALTRPDAELADVLLHPEFGYWVSMSREFRERAIESGYRDTLAAADRIRAMHAA